MLGDCSHLTVKVLSVTPPLLLRRTRESPRVTATLGGDRTARCGCDRARGDRRRDRRRSAAGDRVAPRARRDRWRGELPAAVRGGTIGPLLRFITPEVDQATIDDQANALANLDASQIAIEMRGKPTG
jgi:hypothetical protein